MDPTSFSVRGDDATNAAQEAEGPLAEQEMATDPARIASTDGSSRDPHEDLTPWMLALATTHEGEIPRCDPDDPGARARHG